MVSNPVNIKILGWEKLWFVCLGSISVQVIESLENNTRIFIVKFTKLVLIDLILRIKKDLITLFIIPPLAFMSIMNSPIIESGLNLFSSDKLSISLLIELNIHLILINDMT